MGDAVLEKAFPQRLGGGQFTVSREPAFGREICWRSHLFNPSVLSGAGHFEMGHIPVSRVPGDEHAVSQCPVHVDCLEGLASGPSIKTRWGKPLSAFDASHPGLAVEAAYLAQLCRTITLTHMPARIILGGGVMKTPGLIEAVRRDTRRSLGGYVASVGDGDLSDYITLPGLGDDAGITGALLLARQALES